jgi:hypothetical protein
VLGARGSLWLRKALFVLGARGSVVVKEGTICVGGTR